ncbi:alpha/beta hydrolase [Burkholderia sp. S171]|uniref:alpha/beta hydrolase n=1 Tax=Burkholderia sp. S171 TaxID=1641860 RepID=UPI00131E0311|nr:alpha/beta fold hydrolase [Burkholderia sp. S171]
MAILTALALAAAIQSGTQTLPVQTDIDASGPTGPLRGTLLAPATSGVPVILIIPGSGPTDRNGNGPGMRASTYRLLAEGLSTHGITTVRVDKRGMYGSASAVPDADEVTINDYANDVHSWVATIRKRTGVTCVWVLGHSEGGLVALVAGQNTNDICGLILVATPGRPLGDVLREQFQSTPAFAPFVDHALSVLDVLEAGQHVDAARIDPALMPSFRPQIQDFVMSELSLDPARLIASYTKPVLIVQGQRDVQVKQRDAKRLKQADPESELVLLANTNHVLKVVTTTDRAENIATYLNPNLPLANNVIDVIANFVTSSLMNR